MALTDGQGQPAPFRPFPLLSGFHRQTLTAAFLRGERWRVGPRAQALVIPAEDGGALALEVSWQPDAHAPVFVLSHGLSGSARSPYMLGTARKAFAAGFSVVRMNQSGAGAGLLLARRPYHCGRVDDLTSVLSWLEQQRRGPVVLCGFSIGGNQALRLAGLEGRAFGERVAALAAVSPPVDVDACARALDEQPAARLYRNNFVRELMVLARSFAARGCGAREYEALGRPRAIREYDDRFTAKIHGFRDAEDYYAQASSLPHLGRVSVPTLVIHAADDALVPASSLQGLRLPTHSPLQLLLTQAGGHCAFLAAARGHEAGQSDLDRSWAENRVVRFLARAVGLRSSASI